MTDAPPCFLVAPDKFKGSLTAVEVAEALAAGLRAASPEARVTFVPLADGGDGTVEGVLRLGYRPQPVVAVDALGDPRECRIAVRGESAVVELAEVCGLHTGGSATREPTRATSRGLGLAIVAALDAGCSDLLVGIGGSASTDGGAGMLTELGVSLLDADGLPVDPRPLELVRIVQADLSTVDPRLQSARLRFAVDVDAPLTGPTGAAAVFGPQKGATPEQVAALNRALQGWSELWPGVDPATPGAGAAGGVGFAARVLGAELVSGAEEFLALAGFADALTSADVVVTGEGRLDRQTLMGKGPAVVARYARRAGVPVVAVVGGRSDDVTDEELGAAGITDVHTLVGRLGEAAHDPARAREALRQIGEEIARAAPPVRPGRA